MYAKSSQVDKKISRAGLARVFNITTSDTRKRLKPSVTCLSISVAEPVHFWSAPAPNPE